MKWKLRFTVFLTVIVTLAEGVSLRKQLEHVKKTLKQSLAYADLKSPDKMPSDDWNRGPSSSWSQSPASSALDPTVNQRRQNEGVLRALHYNNIVLPLPQRRFFPSSGYTSVILGGPSDPSHLPAAEPILPGHTLIRPSLNMLKSAVKFPHKDMDNGAGVYGNIDNLGLKYDGLNDRVLYSGFRRMPTDYIMIVPVKSNTNRVSNAIVSPVVLDLDKTTDDFYLEGGKLNDLTQERSIYTKDVDNMVNNAIKNVASALERQKRNVRKGENGNVSSSAPNDNSTTEYPCCPCPKTADKFKKLISVKKPQKHRNIESIEYGTSLSEELFHIEPEISQFEIIEDKAKMKSDNNKRQLWNTKNSYNHVKFSPNAPEYADITPKEDLKKLRQWWFYHQEDFEPFEEQHL